MEDKIKILQVIGSLHIGGAENMAMNFCRKLNKEKFQCDFLVFDGYREASASYEAEAIALGANILRIPQPSNDYIAYYQNLKRVMISGKYDVVHAHLLLNNGFVLKAAKDANILKRISHSHSTASGRKERFVYKLYKQIMKKIILKYSTDIIACGEDAGNYLYGKHAFRKNGMTIKNGIDLNQFIYFDENNLSIRQEFSLGNALVLGHIGRLATVKNHDFLIDVFFEVHKLDSNVMLLIVGDGELKELLEKKVKKLNLSEYVIFTGVRSDISKLLHGMDLFVFPSFFEGLPVSLIEAQATGMKCFVSSTITKEVKLVEGLHFLSLEDSAKDWALEIYNNKDYHRKNVSEYIARNGYDINKSICELEKIYLMK